ncbi:hypothetical protein [Flavobacterium enshiense]|uniref:Uncharacterized protein n=1 Tax=Flavobacterium enshiense DK69 TaxID=1107311 RepID=A0A0A2MS00_9FLAO|nr:hypothetical protein [Flavobacterium enshiense]KGO95457.1 hypothetical protein Q767_11695 [Flavobacterium enshiense DK69]
MSNSPQINPNDQEIDLGKLSKKVGEKVQSFIDWLFDGVLFIRRNIVIIGILFVLGVGLGIYKDKNTKVYDHEVIVKPNFGSTDYLYSKIKLISSKINEGDTVFLKQIGIVNPKKFSKIKIEPITDVYRFINGNDKNFEMLKLMAEDGDLTKIVEDNVTSKNYMYHTISFTTSGLTSEKNTLIPLLNYLNDSEFYQKMQKEQVNNITLKIKENDSIISQINAVMNQFSNAVSNNQKSDKLVYYNENTQLDDVLKTKEELVKEQGYNRLELVSADKIIKESSHILNVRNNKATKGKMKLILPVFFIGLFAMLGMLRDLYRRQLAKRNLI